LAEATSSYAMSAAANATPARQPTIGIQMSSTGVAAQITNHHAKPWSGLQMAGLSGVHPIVEPAAAAINAKPHAPVSSPLGTHRGTPSDDQRAAASVVKGWANGSTKVPRR